MYVCTDKQSVMNQRFTYSIPPHTLSFLATGNPICVAEPRPHTYGEIVRADKRDTRRWMVNPLMGITPAHRTSLGYRYVSPNGDRLPSAIEGRHSAHPQPTANYSLLTANSSFVSGGGGLQEIDMVEEGQSELIVSHQERFEELFNNLAACLDADFHSAEDMLKPLYKWQNVKKVESDCYWYHPDHLGSSSWITDSAGKAVQHLHYLPWGEDFVNQRLNSFDGVRYTFSAKEKDSETGLSYFGSRYYSSDLSIWLSVDPMAVKYPHQSNYVYCGNNPLKVIDPNGEDEWEVNQSGYVRHIQNDKPDRLYAVYGFGKDRWGKRKPDVEPLKVDKSIMKTMDSRNKYTTFSVQNNRAKMDELFDFFADNTDVEWTQLSIHDDFENQYDYLSTSHENINSDLPSTYKVMVHANAKKGTLDTFKHSHPNNYTGFIIYYQIIYPYTCHTPSGDDGKTKNEILDECRLDKPQPQFFLRNGGHNYVY